LNLLDHIPVVFDFPKRGIGFRDISPLLANPAVLDHAIQGMSGLFDPQSYTHIAGVESRGFIFGMAMSRYLGKPFVMVRKANKLPPETFRVGYDLEYGQDHLEIRRDILKSSDTVLIVDDVLATGGTALAAQSLISMSGASTVGLAVLLEIVGLNGAFLCQANGLHAKSVLYA